MTRKRFVKLLMAEGYSRNKANSIARETSTEGWSYSLKYYFLDFVNKCPDFTEMTNTAIKKMVDVIVDVIPSVVEAIMTLMPAAVEAVQTMKALEKEMEAITNE